jgi:hypothetical protein
MGLLWEQIMRAMVLLFYRFCILLVFALLFTFTGLSFLLKHLAVDSCAACGLLSLYTRTQQAQSTELCTSPTHGALLAHGVPKPHGNKVAPTLIFTASEATQRKPVK